MKYEERIKGRECVCIYLYRYDDRFLKFVCLSLMWSNTQGVPQKLICFRVSLKPEIRSFAQDSSCKPSLKGLEAATVHLDIRLCLTSYYVYEEYEVWQYPLQNKQCLGLGNKTDQNISKHLPKLTPNSFGSSPRLHAKVKDWNLPKTH